MPNYIKSIVKTSERTLKEIKNKYFENNELTFQKIIPMPKSLELTNGSITDKAIYYAYLKKSDSERREIESLLKSVKDYIHGNLWNQVNEYCKNSELSDLEEINSKFEPEELHQELKIKNLEELGDAYIDNIKKYNYPTWYDWSYENWGTKWDLSSFECDNTTMIFETAWNPPVPILQFLSKEFPNEIIKLDYSDEDISNNGTLFFENGEIESQQYDKGDDFAEEVWGAGVAIEEPNIEIEKE